MPPITVMQFPSCLTDKSSTFHRVLLGLIGCGSAVLLIRSVLETLLSATHRNFAGLGVGCSFERGEIVLVVVARGWVVI